MPILGLRQEKCKPSRVSPTPHAKSMPTADLFPFFDTPLGLPTLWVYTARYPIDSAVGPVSSEE
jgi:hypothetical protein